METSRPYYLVNNFVLNFYKVAAWPPGGYAGLMKSAGYPLATLFFLLLGIARGSDDFYAAPGKYTMLLAATGTAAGIPQGSGRATLTLGKTGKIAIAGLLADGESFTASSVITGGTVKDGCVVDIPLAYPAVTVKRAAGLLSGTLNFVTDPAACHFYGTLAWTKPEQKRGAYPAAIDTDLDVSGSIYAPPAHGSSALPGFPGGTLVLSDSGALSESGSTELVQDVTLTSHNALAVTKPPMDGLKVTLTPSNGVFKGSFLYPIPGKKPKLVEFSGVLFQDLSNGGGFFIGPAGSGIVSLSGS